MHVSSGVVNSNQIVEIQSEAASRKKSHRAKNYVLATGGILGGGLCTSFDGGVAETIFQIPANGPKNRSEWFSQKFLSVSGHPIFQAGISVNSDLQPLELSSLSNCDNLFVVGNLLAGNDYIQERSRDGVALATGYYLGNNIK
jgi:glycerol-3-phosphate dehydrogenase subunit B